MNKGKTRSYLYGFVGAYMLYTAYDLFKGRLDPETTMSRGLLIGFVAFFILAGAFLLYIAVRMWIRSGAEEKRLAEEEANAGDEANADDEDEQNGA